jgi:23S rRNA pseudouridine1911/1915/1917 synthase
MKKFPRKGRRRNQKPDAASRSDVRPQHAKTENAKPYHAKPKRANSKHASWQRPAPAPHDDKRRHRFSRELSVLYEDDAVVIVDKPPGLLAVPIKGSQTPSAWSLLAEALELKKQRALIVHRIDRFSSGALLFAKTSADRAALVKQFLAHTPVRQYLAVVRGRVGNEAGTLVHYFAREGMYQQLRSAKDPDASRAELRYKVERLFADASLVRVELVTGLQNQIRVQFSALGHPIVGDRKYQHKEALEPLIDRVALHAAHLEFVHPRTGKTVSVDCKQPPDFQHLIRELSRAAVPSVARSAPRPSPRGLPRSSSRPTSRSSRRPPR